MAAELTDTPRFLKIMGEELVAFRDKSGQIGLLHAHCAHRGASLEYGAIQEKGIMCCYHGMVFDCTSQVAQQRLVVGANELVRREVQRLRA